MLKPSSHPLDAPIWTALNTHHARHSFGDGLAKRYAPSLLPFADLGDTDSGNWRALHHLVKAYGPCILIRTASFTVPDPLEANYVGSVQMIAEAVPSPASPDPVIELTGDDMPDMLALRETAQPGPLSPDAFRLGRFWGIRRDGHLVAMAGERFNQPGFTEATSICTHPGYRGLGLAGAVTCRAVAEISRSGKTPYLHVFATNTAAIALYRKLGFRERTKIFSAVVNVPSAS